MATGACAALSYPRGVHGQDPRHRREAVRGPGSRPRAARSVREATGAGDKTRACWRALSTSSPGPSATSCSSPSPTSTTTSSRSGGWPTCRSCPRTLQARRARRALQEADEGRPRPAAPRRRRDRHQRLRRRARGRADLRLPVREGQGQEARQAAVAELDDQARRCARPSASLRDGAELGALRDAARSRSEADWIVGMNATRAATIRLRSSFDGAVSLGRVQTPDAGHPRPPRGGDPRLQARAVLARRRGLRGRRRAPLRGPLPRRRPAAARDRRRGRGDRRRRARPARRDHQARQDQAHRERPPLLYDLTSLQREANTRFGFSARRTLAAAQRCYEEHKALTYPRTNSRYLTSDMVRRDQADRRAGRRAPRVRATARTT